MNWKHQSPFPWIMIGLMCCATLAVGLQYAATWVTALLARLPVHALTIWEYLGLWGTASPSARTGVLGWDIAHGVLVGFGVATIIAGTVLICVALYRHGKNPEYVDGLASGWAVSKHAGRRQLVKRAAELRPSVTNPQAEDVGFLLATFRGTEVWASVEDPIILVGPSRSGKGVFVILKMIVRAIGAVVTSSCKLDNVKLLLEERKRYGRPVRVFAPATPAAEALGHQLRWDPLAGCEDEDVLQRRLSGMVSSSAFSGSTTNGGHWDRMGKQLAAGLFHAAALGGRTVDDVWSWVVNSSRATAAVDLIRNDPRGIQSYADILSAVLDEAPDNRAVQWGTLKTALAYLGTGSLRKWLKPEPGEQFDAVRFILERGTVFMIGNEDGTGDYQQITNALVEEINWAANGLGGAMPKTRLDPPISFILDELGNFHLDCVPTLISAGGGMGKQVVAVVQSRSQLAKWGPDSERSMWDAASIKVVLPGGADEQNLQSMSTLIGERTEDRVSFSHSLGGSSEQWSSQERSILTAAELRTLEKGTAVIFHRETKAIIGRMTPWETLPEAAAMKASEDKLSGVMQEQSPFAAKIKEHQAQQQKQR